MFERLLSLFVGRLVNSQTEALVQIKAKLLRDLGHDFGIVNGADAAIVGGHVLQLPRILLQRSCFLQIYLNVLRVTPIFFAPQLLVDGYRGVIAVEEVPAAGRNHRLVRGNLATLEGEILEGGAKEGGGENVTGYGEEVSLVSFFLCSSAHKRAVSMSVVV